jgi:site-specific DNA-methyltransferase (adenine-specific)
VFRLHHGDCIAVLQKLASESIDSCVTDPPYELGFMGKGWDKTGIANNVELWVQVLRVLKPGGHLLAFSGTRTYHRMVCAIEDAGFEIRDQIGWLYGSGFPKSLDVSKAIDKRAGAKRNLDGYTPNGRNKVFGNGMGGGITLRREAPITQSATDWNGWGTALKPAWEPIVLARKPLIGTVAENVLAHGTGAINVDGCRVGVGATDPNRRRATGDNGGAGSMFGVGNMRRPATLTLGRWPANVIHDGSDEALAEFAKYGESKSTGGSGPASRNYQSNGRTVAGSCAATGGLGDTGTAARFFYCAKASKKDRDEGLSGPEKIREAKYGNIQDARPHTKNGYEYHREPRKNNHPTVKPTALMRYLCKLVTPPKGIILDPFTGSGSTGKAAKLEGFSFIGIEREAEYIAIARARIKNRRERV